MTKLLDNSERAFRHCPMVSEAFAVNLALERFHDAKCFEAMGLLTFLNLFFSNSSILCLLLTMGDLDRL